ncbi:transposase [Roseovarius sp. A21]|uniref:Transposase n=1 Tax=Roseovarius bejariae TaxID=2576383 RepID=A0A844CJS0_9RHOB|nr:transposase [Roseovarius bejariae]
MQNGLVESSRGRMRSDCRKEHQSLRPACRIITACRDVYNHHRSRSRLDVLSLRLYRQCFIKDQNLNRANVLTRAKMGAGQLDWLCPSCTTETLFNGFANREEPL